MSELQLAAAKYQTGSKMELLLWILMLATSPDSSRVIFCTLPCSLILSFLSSVCHVSFILPRNTSAYTRRWGKKWPVHTDYAHGNLLKVNFMHYDGSLHTRVGLLCEKGGKSVIDLDKIKMSESIILVSQDPVLYATMRGDLWKFSFPFRGIIERQERMTLD